LEQHCTLPTRSGLGCGIIRHEKSIGPVDIDLGYVDLGWKSSFVSRYSLSSSITFVSLAAILDSDDLTVQQKICIRECQDGFDNILMVVALN
jgi:hypothetical protein